MKSNKFSIDDSIILDPERSRSNNVKKILTVIAILVVLFLIVLIIMKFINSGNEVDNKPLVMPSEELIFNPKVEAQPQKPIVIEERPKPAEPAQDVKLAEPTLTEPKLAEPKPVETIPADTQAPKQEITTPIQTEPKAKTKQVEPAKDSAKLETKPTKKEVVVVTAKKDETKAQVAKKEGSKTPTKTEPKPAEPVKTGTLQTGDIPKGNYIQIVATSDFKADADSIKKLTNSGYNYRLYKMMVNGQEFTKVLVGPYDSAQLEKEMPKIRASVNKDAFIFKVQ